jgi:hypothetical protein
MSRIPRVAFLLRMTTDRTGGVLSLAGPGTHNSVIVDRLSPVIGHLSRGEGRRTHSGFTFAPFAAGAGGVSI